MSVKSRKNPIFHDRNALDEECIAGAFSIGKSPFSPSQEPGKRGKKGPSCVTGQKLRERSGGHENRIEEKPENDYN